MVSKCHVLTLFILVTLLTDFLTYRFSQRPHSLTASQPHSLTDLLTYYITDVLAPSAASQGLSTLCGLLLPFCPCLRLWLPTCALSIGLYAYVWRRLYVRTASVARLRAMLSPRSYELRSATLALLLLRQCVATWTVLVGVWTVDVIARCVLGYSPATLTLTLTLTLTPTLTLTSTLPLTLI